MKDNPPSISTTPPQKTPWINVLTLSISFMIIFIAFSTSSSYVSTLHSEIGNISQGIIYITFAFGNFFSPLFIYLIGSEKAAVMVGGLLYIPYIVCIGFNVKWLLLFTAFLVGIGASWLWVGQGVLLSTFAGDRMAFFSGVFVATFQMNGIFGYLIAGVVKLFLSNVYLFVILGVIGVIGVLMITLLKYERKKRMKMTKKVIAGKLLSAAWIALDLKFLLIMPSYILQGFNIGFIFGNLTVEVGEDLIAWTMLLSALVQFFGSLYFGRLAQNGGILLSFYLATLCFVISVVYSSIIPMFPKDHQQLLYFVLMSFYGLSHSSLKCHNFAFLGTYFSDDPTPAFSASRLFQSVSAALKFFTSSYFTYFQNQMILVGIIVVEVISITILNIIEPADKFKVENKKELHLYKIYMNKKKEKSKIENDKIE